MTVSDAPLEGESPDDPRRDEADTEETGGEAAGDEPLTEDDYAQGGTSEPGGASRDEPAGEDYAGSGF